MKKITSLLLAFVLVASLFALASCGGEKIDENTIVVGASSTPHAEILEQVKGVLAEQGYTLEIKVFDDYILPNTAALLQDRFGAKNAFCFDISTACTGLISSLEVAFSLLEARKNYRHALVFGAEKLSCIANWTDRNTCVLFGDGASCILLEKTDDDGPSALLASSLHAAGQYGSILKIPAGGSAMPASQESIDGILHTIHMEGKETFKLAVGAMVSASEETIAAAGVSADDIALVIPHQANIRIIQAVAKRLTVDNDRVYCNIAKYGNTSAASIGICFDEAVRSGRLKRGDLVLMTSFGGGLTWGALLIRY